MTQSNNKRPSPLSIRMSPEHRARLKQAAGGLSLSGYIHDRLFDENGNVRASELPKAGIGKVKDRAALAQALARMGQLRLSEGFNALSEAAKIGVLPVTDETETKIKKACQAVDDIKALLMQSLGIKER